MLLLARCVRVVSSWNYILNLVLVGEPIERLACVLGTIVVDGPSWFTKSVNDMMSDEVDHVGGFNFSERDVLCPLWEVISYRKDEPMTSSWQRTDWSYCINSPSFEWSCCDCGMKQFWGLVYKIHIDLTSLTPFCIFDYVGDYSWPIIAKLVQSILELWPCLMSSTYAIVSLFDNFLCLWIG